jgi:hypothetical protein
MRAEGKFIYIANTFQAMKNIRHDYSGFKSLDYIRCMHLSGYLTTLSVAQSVLSLMTG